MGPTLLGQDHVRACSGRYGDAWSGMTRTLQWLESLRQTRYQLMAHDFLGQLLLDLGLCEQAIEQSERGLALGRAANITFWRPRIEVNRAIARLRLGDLEVGAALRSALDRCRQDEEGLQMARCLEGLTELALARGDADECLRLSRELLSLAEPAGLRELAGVARRWCGEALIAKGDERAAAAELALASRTARDVGRVRLAFDVECARARLGEKSDPDQFAARIRQSVEGTGLELRP